MQHVPPESTLRQSKCKSFGYKMGCVLSTNIKKQHTRTKIVVGLSI